MSETVIVVVINAITMILQLAITVLLLVSFSRFGAHF